MPNGSKTEFIIKTIKSASMDDLMGLYKDAGWWDSSFEEHPESLQSIVKDSALFVGAFAGQRLVGMGRALSDLASDAYIQDVAVLKTFRGKGIGEKIVQTLVKRLKEKGVDWIGLVAEPGTSSFYTKLGFETLKDHVPLKYKD
ncbi:predicted acetyltransferase, GNAT family [Desulfobacula toluolica Tol2]|uniref:Predicted acetyltransferase, GNAT family n=2 Tax=Desulfobacula toluolica TaxID=28223 RepID=K0NN18_DESTT|nr:predicted acetyltransferase, GNAT family [Desulfobacula toluolica Tol2]